MELPPAPAPPPAPFSAWPGSNATYKLEKEAHVQGHAGGALLEVSAVAAAFPCLYALHCAALGALAQLRRAPRSLAARLALELVTIAAPALAAMTVLGGGGGGGGGAGSGSGAGDGGGGARAAAAAAAALLAAAALHCASRAGAFGARGRPLFALDAAATPGHGLRRYFSPRAAGSIGCGGGGSVRNPSPSKSTSQFS